MDLFGGLKDEGGKVDRKSGNKVPIGSTKKEVRDDIPAQLSEGEFVLPADVVRYHGLEKLMKLRQEAKGGLKTMDKMGQMGNADEATLPDDMPFRPEFQQGGAVQAPQVMQSNIVPGVQFTPPQMQQQIPSMFAPPAVGAPVPIVQPVQRPVYTPPTYQEPISFKNLVGTDFGQLQKTETRKYVNESGEELFIPFVNGKPIYPIPAGYKEFKEDTTTPPPVDKKVTAPTATVTGDDSGDDLSTSIKTTKVSKIASDAAGGQKSLKDFFTTGTGKSIAGSVLGMATLGPVGAIIGGLLGKSLTDNKQELAQQMGAIPGTTAPIGPERDFEKLSQEAYGKSLSEMTTILGGGLGAGFTNVTPTFSYGFNPGDVDVVTGGTFNSAGIAVDENGNMATSNGVPSYASFSDFVDAMSASAKTGYYGGPVSKAEYDNMSQKGKDLYDAYATETNQPSYETKDPDVEDISPDVPSVTQTQPDPIDTSDYMDDTRDDEPVDDSTPTQTQPDPIDTTGDPFGGSEGSGVSTGDPTGGGGGSDIGSPSQGDASSMGLDDDVMGQSVGPGGSDTAGDSDAGGCVIATHGLSTGGFTAMEKAKAELWCAKTYHGKWYGEAFRRGYRAAGMKHINAGTAPSVYQEFKDFVAYGRGIKKGWKIGFNYYLRTIAFFIHGLFIK